MIGNTNADSTLDYDPMYNYTGDGSDGDVVVAAGETYVIQVTEDVESAELNCNSLFVEAGGKITTSGRCQGLFIKTKGDCTINGTIDMNCKAPLLAETEDEAAMNPCMTLCGNLVGGNGGNGGLCGRDNYGNWSQNSTGGTGGAGHVFGGGMGGGGGGSKYNGGSGTRPPVGVTWPYRTAATGQYGSGGGGGFDGATSYGGYSPGGSGGVYSAYYTDGDGSASPVHGNAGNAYGGGAIYLFAGGKLTIGTTGLLTANGGNGANSVYGNHESHYTSDSTVARSTYYSGSGGGGGGGVICIVYRDTIVHGGTLSVAGGSNGTSDSSRCVGAAGSVGTTLVEKFENLLL